MKILVIGNGGREHALTWKLAQSPRVPTLYCAPGNAGMAQVAECVPLKADDITGLKAFAQDHHIDLTVVGPELPLSLGIADEFRKSKLRIFGPTRNAALIESSKSFAKELMIREKIATPASRTFDSLDSALVWLTTCPLPVVVKADGLAQGKGICVMQGHCAIFHVSSDNPSIIELRKYAITRDSVWPQTRRFRFEWRKPDCLYLQGYGCLPVLWTETRIAFPLWLPLAMCVVLPVAQFARHFLRRRRRPPGTCSQCGYNLTGNSSGTCPECGTRIGE